MAINFILSPTLARTKLYRGASGKKNVGREKNEGREAPVVTTNSYPGSGIRRARSKKQTSISPRPR